LSNLPLVQQKKEGVKPGGFSQEWFLYCGTKIKKRQNKKKRGKKRKNKKK
jgi:hypothetical protein